MKTEKYPIWLQCTLYGVSVCVLSFGLNWLVVLCRGVEWNWLVEVIKALIFGLLMSPIPWINNRLRRERIENGEPERESLK